MKKSQLDEVIKKMVKKEILKEVLSPVEKQIVKAVAQKHQEMMQINRQVQANSSIKTGSKIQVGIAKIMIAFSEFLSDPELQGK